MGSTDFGTQTLLFDYRNPATGCSFNVLNYQLIPPGIYSGGTLTRVNDTAVSISPLTCYIQDSSTGLGVRISTANAYQLTVSTTLIYVVLRFTWSNTVSNYMDMLAVTSANILSDDIVLGRCVFGAGNVLSATFDSTRRSTGSLQTIEDDKNKLRVYSTEAISQKIFVCGGEIVHNNTVITVADQCSGNVSSTAADADCCRKDIVYLDCDGCVQVGEGAYGASPSAPSYNDKIVLAEITRTCNRTDIAGNEITQVNPSRERSNVFDYCVGIGESSPSQCLHIGGVSSGFGLRIDSVAM